LILEVKLKQWLLEFSLALHHDLGTFPPLPEFLSRTWRRFE
jgi:hypothetical protein